MFSEGAEPEVKVNVIIILGALGVASLVGHARGDDDDDVEAIADAYSNDGTTLLPGPLHERLLTEDTRARLQAEHERAPDDDVATIRLAVFESKRGRPGRAITLLGEVSAISSLRALALYDLGILHLRGGNASLAASALSDAAAIASDRAEPELALGLADQRLGEVHSAITAFESAEKLAQGTLAATCAIRAGKLHESSGELDEALAAFERASSLESAPVGSAAQAGVALGASPNGARAAAGAGRVLLELGRTADAAPELEKSLAAKDDPDVRFLYGLALVLSGKAGDADAQVERLRGHEPALAARLAELIASKRGAR